MGKCNDIQDYSWNILNLVGSNIHNHSALLELSQIQTHIAIKQWDIASTAFTWPAWIKWISDDLTQCFHVDTEQERRKHWALWHLSKQKIEQKPFFLHSPPSLAFKKLIFPHLQSSWRNLQQSCLAIQMLLLDYKIFNRKIWSLHSASNWWAFTITFAHRHTNTSLSQFQLSVSF